MLAAIVSDPHVSCLSRQVTTNVRRVLSPWRYLESDAIHSCDNDAQDRKIPGNVVLSPWDLSVIR